MQTIATRDVVGLLAESGRTEFAAKSSELPTTGRRLAFAHWLTGPDNPLTARVIANRVWMHHFGRGLVSTPADFGRLGSLPTHPELLDWLAAELRDSGWSLKHLHRLIMLSTAYRQSSRREPDQMAIDAENRYYGRQNVLRLDAEDAPRPGAGGDRNARSHAVRPAGRASRKTTAGRWSWRATCIVAACICCSAARSRWR